MRAIMQELLVPALMLSGVALYWFDANGLSSMALAFPGALMIVILLCVGLIVIHTLFGRYSQENIDAETVFEKFKPWLIILVPIPLIVFWHDIGALPALFVLILSLLALLGERRLVWLVAFPLGLSVPLYFLFKTVLYVRLPGLPVGYGF